MTNRLIKDFLDTAKADFLRYKRLGAEAIDILDDDELNSDPHRANSIVIIVKHLRGNMRSRWTNLFTEDGEKPDRNRDAEFESEHLTKERVRELYNEGWSCVEKALSQLSDEDFSRPVIIRNEAHTLIEAIGRQLMHSAYHIGQIVLIAKQCKGPGWKSLSIPKGQSSAHVQGRYHEKGRKRE